MLTKLGAVITGKFIVIPSTSAYIYMVEHFTDSRDLMIFHANDHIPYKCGTMLSQSMFILYSKHREKSQS